MVRITTRDMFLVLAIHSSKFRAVLELFLPSSRFNVLDINGVNGPMMYCLSILGVVLSLGLSSSGVLKK